MNTGIIIAIIWLSSIVICYAIRKRNKVKVDQPVSLFLTTAIFAPLGVIILLIKWIVEHFRRFYYRRTKRGRNSKGASKFLMKEHIDGMLREAKRFEEVRKEEPPVVVYEDVERECFFQTRTENEMRSIKSEEGLYFLKLWIDTVPQVNVKCKDYLFETLKSVTLPPNLHLGLYVAQAQKPFGDESYFYVYDDHGRESKDILKYLLVEPTELGVWDVYLLLNSVHYMPLYGSCAYKERTLVGAENVIQNIARSHNDAPVLADADLSTFEWKDKYEPRVFLDEDGADVCCCYWSDWKGLVREYVKVIIKDNKVESYKVEEDEYLFPHKRYIVYKPNMKQGNNESHMGVSRV